MKRLAGAFAALAIALFTGCGGGGGSSSTPSAALATAAPAAGGSATFASSDAVAIPTAAPGAAAVPVPLPSDPGGAAAGATLSSNDAVPADTTIDAAFSSSVDGALPALASSARAPLQRSLREGGLHKVIGALRLRFSADVALSQAPAFSFTIPNFTPAPGATYWLAFYDPLHAAAGWQLGWEGPATLSAVTAKNGAPATKFDFASNGKPLALSAGESYGIALYALAAGSASPTPVPSSVPSNPPQHEKPARVVASPSSLAFPSVSATPASVTFSQTGFTGSFTLHGNCTGVVNTGGTSPTFTVTPVAQGRCVIVGLGDRGASAVVHVGVVTAPETPHPSPSVSPNPSASPSASPSPNASPGAGPSPSPSASAPATTIQH